MRRSGWSCVVLMLVLGSCSDAGDVPRRDDAAAARGSKVTIRATEYTYDAPPTVRGGLVEITLDNSSGAESHEAEMIRLDPGKGIADLRAAFPGHPPEWAHLSGGPGPVLPGKTAVFTGNLPAGLYVLMCQVPASDGRTHLEKGMLAQISITEGPNGVVPEGDATITATEFEFSGHERVTAGTQTVRVVNEGKNHHHFVVFSLVPRKKAADALAFFEGRSTESPIAGRVGLVGTLAPGLSAARTLELVAGQTYILACFISDEAGTPHVSRGMIAEFTT